MTDKELIKEEIERRINISIEQGYTYSAAQLKRVIDFIDSLPEEPVNEEEIEALNSVRYLNPALDSLYLKLKES